MIKKTGLTSLCLLFSLFSFAQEGGFIGFHFISQKSSIQRQNSLIKAGHNLETEFTSGYAYGAVIGYNFADPIGIRTGAFYSRQGQKFNSTNSDATYRLNTEYLKIPVLLHFNSAPGAVIVSGEVGPQVGILMKKEEVYQGVELPVRGEGFASALPEQDISIVVALGTDIRLSKKVYFNLHARMDYGLTDLQLKSDPVTETAFVSARDEASNHMNVGMDMGLTFALNDGRCRGGCSFRR